MENRVRHKRVREWGPVSVVILVLFVLWINPAHAYYICTQPDGSQLITDTPRAGCINQEESAPPTLPSGKKPKELIEKRNPTSPEYSPGEQLDFQGHNREWWRGRLESLKKERRAVSAKISDAKKRFNLIPPYLPDIEQNRREHNIQMETYDYREQLQEIDQLIEKGLPEEARKAGAPPGWVRE